MQKKGPCFVIKRVFAFQPLTTCRHINTQMVLNFKSNEAQRKACKIRGTFYIQAGVGLYCTSFDSSPVLTARAY